MPKERAKRKLSAILGADMGGSSHPRVNDEIATVSTLVSHRNRISEKGPASKGKVFGSSERSKEIMDEYRVVPGYGRYPYRKILLAKEVYYAQVSV